MMHLKNIKPGNPKTEEQYLLTKNSGVVWLWTEDGKNWYEEQKNFQDDTIKIAYDENGSDSNLLIVFYVQIMPDDLVMQLHRF